MHAWLWGCCDYQGAGLLFFPDLASSQVCLVLQDYSHHVFLYLLIKLAFITSIPGAYTVALESITMNKASGGNGIPVEVFQILKDDAVPSPAWTLLPSWRGGPNDPLLPGGHWSSSNPPSQAPPAIVEPATWPAGLLRDPGSCPGRKRG